MLAHPRLMIVPLVLLVLCLALGLFGVLRAADQARTESRARAQRLAQDKAHEVAKTLEAAAVPCRATATMVQAMWQTPEFILPTFLQQGQSVFKLVPDQSVYALSISPQGVAGVCRRSLCTCAGSSCKTSCF